MSKIATRKKISPSFVAPGYLTYIRAHYQMPWLENGLRVEFEGKPGTITGFINSYVQIQLDGETVAQPYHPKWEMKYFDVEGNVLGDFTKEGEQ